MMKTEDYKDAMRDLENDIDEFYGETLLFARCLMGMAVTGGAVTLAPGVAIAIYGDGLAGLAVGLSGFIAKPLAYYAAHILGRGTEWGEYGYGAAIWAVAGAVMAAASLGYFH